MGSLPLAPPGEPHPQLHHRRQEIHVIVSICKKGERYKKTFFGSLQGKEMYGSLQGKEMYGEKNTSSQNY